VTKGSRPHYLPAGLIGGFGRPGAGKRAVQLRSAYVCVRWTIGEQAVTVVRADKVAFQYGVYDVDQPGPDLAAGSPSSYGNSTKADCPPPSRHSTTEYRHQLNGRRSLRPADGS
jgi:hypothetical protein